jgi:hypothetical protein
MNILKRGTHVTRSWASGTSEFSKHLSPLYLHKIYDSHQEMQLEITLAYAMPEYFLSC